MDFRKIDLKPAFKFIIQNPTRKIFAIIFAFGLWFYVAIDKDYQYTKKIDIFYTSISESLILVDSVSNIDVTFTGRGGTLLSIWAVTPKAYCDLSNSTKGKNDIPVRKIIIPIGFGDVSIVYPNTKSISITLDKKMVEELKIIVPVKNSPRENYSIKDITVLDTVTVIGPADILVNIRELTTESLDVRNRFKSFRKNLRVLNPSPLFNLSKERVDVEVSLDPTVEKLFTNIPLKLIYSPNQRVSSDRVSLDTLMVKGPKSKVDELEKKDIEVKIQLTKLSTGEYNLPAEVGLPDYIMPIFSKPQRFKIKIY